MAKTDLNPYAAPSTPSDEISNKPNLAEKGIYVTDTEAFRMGGSLFCTPDFNPPPICLRSGIAVKSELEKTALFVGSSSISIYLTQQQRSKINWDTVPTGQILTILMLLLIVGCMIIHAYFILLIIIPVVIYGCKFPKNHGIKVQWQADGFIEVLNAHPDFLSYFPTKSELKST